MKKWLSFVIGFMMALSASPAFAADKTLIRVCGQPAMHGMPTWENMRNGSLEKAGLDVKFQIFSSGPAQIEAFAAGQWDVGTVGTIPAMLSNLRYDSVVIGIYSDDSETNALFVRPDSPMLKTKGYNPKYPDVYGTPEDWKGKKVLCTTMTNGHYVLSTTLKALGLTDKDVNITQIEPGQAMAAFAAGQGDIVQLWAPSSFVAEGRGWKRVSSGGSAKIVIPGVIMVNRKYAAAHTDAVVAWLDLYLRVVESMPKNKDKAIDQLYTFFRDYCSLALDKEQVALDFKYRRLFNLDQQIEALSDPNQMLAWMTAVAEFMHSGKRISDKDLQKYRDIKGNIDPKYMKLVAEKRAKEAAKK